ncbi:MAG TPA: cob(I)yrinic acid a,c-diamide adenosyltransferase [Candidatus Paceibacterota bacterium]|nr:cob(I)yrinic acid a,c-diamide adenosyltransferase [Candidatus Paceibacterota bacterium]
MALFTGKGDQGTTTAFGCDQKRISKSSELPEALGALDELNAFLGFTKVRASGAERIQNALRDMQENLFIVQAQAGGAEKTLADGIVERTSRSVNEIEMEIPRLQGFCIAGGTELSALLDVCRTLARRAERRVIAVKEQGLRDLPEETMAYLNRLSSLLFAYARLANHLAGVKEENPKY